MDVSRFLVPSLCVVCRLPCDPVDSICRDCLWELDASGPLRDEPPPGIDDIVSVSPHEGVGRQLLVAYKFRGLNRLGGFIAARMAEAVRQEGPQPTVIPVPAARLRRRMRGFDPADDLSRRLATMLELPAQFDAVERIGLGRQRGRTRSGRLGDPPKIRPNRPAAAHILLVDDVTTTGSTLSAVSLALRSNGAMRVSAITFTKRC